jgi:hypothetical protein
MDIYATNTLAVHVIWIYMLLMHGLYMLCGLCGTTALVVHAYVDVCGAIAHIVHARWMHMGPLHWLYVMWECSGYCQRMF